MFRKVFGTFLESRLLSLCVDGFFQNPWNTLLHNSVKNMLSEVIRSKFCVCSKESRISTDLFATILRSIPCGEVRGTQYALVGLMIGGLVNFDIVICIFWIFTYVMLFQNLHSVKLA